MSVSWDWDWQQFNIGITYGKDENKNVWPVGKGIVLSIGFLMVFFMWESWKNKKDVK